MNTIKHKVTQMLISAILLTMSFIAVAADTNPVEKFLPKEGVDYELLKPFKFVRDPKKIEVIEFFWYGCPHCYTLESDLEKWLTTLPSDVDFWRSPAVFGPNWKTHAQVYYTEEALGVLDKTHRAFFDALHIETGDHNHDKLNNIENIKAFFVQLGVPTGTFDSTFKSFIVMTKVEQAEQRGRDYMIDSVPTIIVNGKYKVQRSKHTFEVIDYLINQERANK